MEGLFLRFGRVDLVLSSFRKYEFLKEKSLVVFLSNGELTYYDYSMILDIGCVGLLRRLS
jgi:hypothetical protein